MSAATAPARQGGERAAAVPGMLLLLGIAWVLFSLIIPQLDLRTLKSIAVLLGIALLVSAASELPTAMAAARNWGWSHTVLAVLFLAAGVVALVWPDPTFAVVARLVAWYLLGKGIYDIVNAFVARRAQLATARADETRRAAGTAVAERVPGAAVAERSDMRALAPWWIPMLLGAFEIGIAFWAVSYPRYSITLLLLWIGLAALTTGLTKIAMAYRTAGVREPAAEGVLPPTGFGAPAVTEARTGGRAHRSPA